jgi:glycosyltransferase involved in cell wall biosynthesis
MRILLLTRQFIYNPELQTSGLYKRLTMFIEAMSQIAGLDILFYVNPEIYRSETQISELANTLSDRWKTDVRVHTCPITKFRDETKLMKWLSYGRGIYNFFDQRYYYDMSGREQITALEKCLQNNPDAILSHRLATICPLLLTKKPLPPVFFDLDDIEHIVLERFIQQGSMMKKILLLHLPALYWGEYRAMKLASKTFVCSDGDREYLIGKFKLANIATVPNAIIIPPLRPVTTDPTVLFIGSYFTQNVDAARFLIVSIWPRIIKEMPEARLIIAGLTKEQIDCDMTGINGVEIVGFVDDLDLLYDRVRIVATPILVGGGTRVKIIEAGAYGKPVVSTTVGMEGIDLTPGSEIIVRDDPKEFAEACIELLVDIDLSKRIGLAARKKVTELYDRKKVIKTIGNHIGGMLESAKPYSGAL